MNGAPMVYMLISRNTKTGHLDARPFASESLRKRFRDSWEQQLKAGVDGNTGDYEFAEFHEYLRTK